MVQLKSITVSIEGLSANGSDLYVQFAQRAELTQGRF